jgi:hypothetical protein
MKRKQQQLGNPTLLAMATNEGLQKTALGIGKAVLVGGALALAYFGGKKLLTNLKQDSVARDYGDNTEDGLAAEYAVQMYASFNPVASWLWDGTDEEALFNVAQSMYIKKVSFGRVSTQYKRQFDRNLIDDLQNELSSDDLNKFNSYSKGVFGISGVNYYITTAPTQVFNQQMQVVDTIPENRRICNVKSIVSKGVGKDKMIGFTPKGTRQLFFVNSKTVR